ncbi:MAG: lytic transglycosylase domain-containing protein [Gluconacetobacter diazotrophicus]|nr:lytic transglycosylase domain-containing protein [Gluconacetobacter diazotrophicus]
MPRRLLPSLFAAWCCGCAGPATVGNGTAVAEPAPGSTATTPSPFSPAPFAVPPGSDPLVGQLQTYLRLLGPQGGSAAELSDFLLSVPADWPNRFVLRRRLARAIPLETDPAVLARFCSGGIPGAVPDTDATLLACSALPNGGGTTNPSPVLVADARRAWADGPDDAAGENAFLRDWGRFLLPADQSARFDRLLWNNELPAARRVLPLLAPADRPLAAARLAARAGDPAAPALAAVLPSADAGDPALFLELNRAARRGDRLDEALAAWRDRGAAAESRAAADRLPAFWLERDALARALLAAGRDRDALLVADDPTTALAPAQRLDSDFLCGWILLRRLRDPAGAEARFAPLSVAEAPITRSRGLYWQARARLARGDDAGARAGFAAAAELPTTFYGQLALCRLDPSGSAARVLLDPAAAPPGLSGRLGALPAPSWTATEALDIAGRPFSRAAELLVSWNDPKHARPFLPALDRDLATATDHAAVAALALRLGLPDDAVGIARAAARHGTVLLASGWPRPFEPPAGQPPLPPGLALAVIRQESSFDPGVTSPAGARGLMQLTDATARTVSGPAGRPDLAGGGGALYEPDGNMLLGTGYLSTLLARFGGSVPYAVAGYNAGPNRVDRWLAAPAPAAPDPAGDEQFRMIDWIETIPYAETRNYVQRVIESENIYAALGTA